MRTLLIILLFLVIFWFKSLIITWTYLNKSVIDFQPNHSLQFKTKTHLEARTLSEFQQFWIFNNFDNLLKFSNFTKILNYPKLKKRLSEGAEVYF